jgi:hypothetical protein
MFMALHPCPTCGDEQFDAVVRNSLAGEAGTAGDDLETAYSGPCHTCGTAREFRFRIDDETETDGETVPLALGEPEFGRATPSAIIDAGQWLQSADRILAATPSNVLGVSEEEWEARRFLFKTAAESVAEVLKFIPAGADGVPPQGFWTDEGRAAHDASPERFQRAPLERLRLACLDLTARYDA